jgi:hypothetical protein
LAHRDRTSDDLTRVVRQERKATSPSDDEWYQTIVTFKRHRDLDGTDFREGLEQLIPELRHESDSAYDTAARMERREPADLYAHDGSAITLRVEKKGYTEQLTLAQLDLLRFSPSDLPTSAVLVVSPDEIGTAAFRDLRDRIHIGVDEERVVRLVRTQAERLLEGIKRVQRCLSDYKKRLATIKPATSVAWDALFETTEAWGSQPKEIAKRIADHVRHPKMSEYLSHDDHVALWHENVRTNLKKWRERRGSKPKKLQRK